MEKVICILCEFEENSRCLKKNTKIKLKKKRLCKLYENSEAKSQAIIEHRLNSKKPKIHTRPDWYWDRKNFIRKMKKQRAEEIERTAQQPFVSTADPKHPMTGDLSRFFKSTATEENNE